MSPLDSTWEPGFSLVTSMLSALETSWQLRYINSHLPYHYHFVITIIIIICAIDCVCTCVCWTVCRVFYRTAWTCWTTWWRGTTWCHAWTHECSVLRRNTSTWVNTQVCLCHRQCLLSHSVGDVMLFFQFPSPMQLGSKGRSGLYVGDRHNWKTWKSREIWK